jgi:hypothetical protein
VVTFRLPHAEQLVRLPMSGSWNDEGSGTVADPKSRSRPQLQQ